MRKTEVTRIRIERFLIQKVRSSRWVIDTLAARSMVGLSKEKCIDTVVGHTGLSIRQLERRFQHEVGLSPRCLAPYLGMTIQPQ